MTFKTVAATLAIVTAAGAALAHEDVENPVVAERMELMGSIRESFATIGNMVRGRTDFDAEAAATAREGLIGAAGEIPAKFEAPEMDPESEASPAIWENWDTFTGFASDLEAAAEELETDSLDALRAGMGTIGQSCGGCHEEFRVE